MQDARQAQKNVLPASFNPSSPNLEESMRRLKVHNDDNDNQDSSEDAHTNPFPDRPDAPDCIYYLRTGMCGYGANCKYNHPSPIAPGTETNGELPERVGEPDCKFFLKTGTCKYGTTCKYHHPRDKLDARPPLNILGLPMRQDEKSCPYYMRNGTCKFGIACKFDHPQPPTYGTVLPVTGLPPYGSAGSSLVPPSSLPFLGGMPAWSLSRPPYLTSPRMQGVPAYVPFVLPPSPGAMPVQPGWSNYTGVVSNISSDVLGQNQIPMSRQQPQTDSSTQVQLPERPDQPECQFYMRNGSCKYGSFCKYHHPKERNDNPTDDCIIGPLGLPLRPGQAICQFYNAYKVCKYGAACKYDHPIEGYFNYAVTAIPMQDPSQSFSPQRNSQTLWTPGESSTPRTFKLLEKGTEPETRNKQQNSESVENSNPSEQTSPSNTAASDSLGDRPS